MRSLILLLLISLVNLSLGAVVKCANNACVQFNDNRFAYCVDTYVPPSDKSLVGSVLEPLNSTNNGDYQVCAGYMVVAKQALFATLDTTGVCRVYDSEIFSLFDLDYSDPSYYSQCSFSFFYDLGQIGVAPGCVIAGSETCPNANFPAGSAGSSSSTTSSTSSTTPSSSYSTGPSLGIYTLVVD